eukprot:1196194-Prorocentrum_minimum.AAC.2
MSDRQILFPHEYIASFATRRVAPLRGEAKRLTFVGLRPSRVGVRGGETFELDTEERQAQAIEHPSQRYQNGSAKIFFPSEWAAERRCLCCIDHCLR